MKLIEVPVTLNDTPDVRKALEALINGDHREMSDAEKAFKQVWFDGVDLMLKAVREQARALYEEGKL